MYDGSSSGRPLSRLIERGLGDALADTPVSLVIGPRQAGKSTLVRELAHASGRRVATLDDAPMLAAARTDPAGFLAGLAEGAADGAVAIDEVQRAPELLLAIKASVDRDRRPGRFLLTGSANVLTLPRVADALTGRMEIHALWPFAQAELEGHGDDAVARLFGGHPFAPRTPRAGETRGRRPSHGTSRAREPAIGHAAPAELGWEARIVASGYPEARTRTAARRTAWFAAYLATVLSRDVRDIADIEGLVHLPRLLALLASRVTGLLNEADLARTLGMPHSTLRRYLALLETLFLVAPVPAWFANVGKRFAKAPRMHFGDAGLACHLLGITSVAELRASPVRGALCETFAAAELRKLIAGRAPLTRLMHFRTHAGQEVDLVLEGPKRQLIGIEVKASATVDAKDFAGLRELAALAGPAFHRGVVLYTGTEVVPFDKHLHAAPLSWLWT